MKFRIWHLLIVTAIIAFALALPQLYLRIPGSLYFDSLGHPHGTGLKKWFYESGVLMIVEHYRRGELTRCVWHHPDGTIVADVTVPDKTKTCVGYYLNQNGTVRRKMAYRYKISDKTWRPDGPCKCFDSVGTPTCVEHYDLGNLLRTDPVSISSSIIAEPKNPLE